VVAVAVVLLGVAQAAQEGPALLSFAMPILLQFQTLAVV
jgi:hypothetical protein